MHSKTTITYQVPKNHKNLNKAPGRPIINGVDSLFSRVGEYLDLYLQPTAQQIPLYTKDSRALINHIKNIPLNEHSILASIYVDSFHTNIKRKDAIKAIKWVLNHKISLKNSQIKFMVDVLELPMGSNYFWHAKHFFKQIKGVAMGSKYAPTVTNIFMRK